MPPVRALLHIGRDQRMLAMILGRTEIFRERHLPDSGSIQVRLIFLTVSTSVRLVSFLSDRTYHDVHRPDYRHDPKVQLAHKSLVLGASSFIWVRVRVFSDFGCRRYDHLIREFCHPEGSRCGEKRIDCEEC